METCLERHDQKVNWERAVEKTLAFDQTWWAFESERRPSSLSRLQTVSLCNYVDSIVEGEASSTAKSWLLQ